jgi:diguanylate cyclase (GGDEF)-like protein
MTTPPPPREPGPPPAGEAELSATDQAESLLRTIPIGFAGSVLPAMLLAWELRERAPGALLATWFGAILVAHGLRLGVWYAARDELQAGRDGARWLRWLRLSVFALGLVWAMLPLLPARASAFDELLVAAVIAAVCGAGAAQQSSDATSSLLFMLPPALSSTMRLFLSGDATLQPIGALALLYYGYLALAGQRTESSFVGLSRLRARAAHQSLHDALTGLPNRLALNLRLHDALARARRAGTQVAVGYIDLDGFKEVNDRHGHAAGDTLLRELAARWSAQQRASELIARLGGDEFVVVIEELDPAQAAAQLGAVFSRIHEAGTAPVALAGGASAQVGMTLGVARYPLDATEPDRLLRVADASMYQLKQHKATRDNWWQFGISDAADAPERELPPYGADAAAVLVEHAAWTARINADYAQTLAHERRGDAGAGVEAAQATRHDALDDEQLEQLRLLVAPDTTREALQQGARQLGTLHCLAGVSGSSLARASVTYRTMLADALGGARLSASRRWQLLRIIDARAHDALQAEFAAAEDVTQAYMQTLSRPRPDAGTRWSDASQREIDFIAALPGIVAVALIRPDRAGELVVERSAAHDGEAQLSALFARGRLPSLDPQTRNGHSATADAWRTLQTQRVGDWAHDAQVATWRDAGVALHVRAEVAVPFGGRDARAIGVLTLFGEQHGQFATSWMRQWAVGLQRRFEAIWTQCHAPPGAAVLSQEQARALHEQLFGGGLEMHGQPIVALRGRRTVGIEALARLRMPDGQLLEPAAFLPSLGEVELDRLFRLGLEQALAALSAADVDLSINLPASTLLGSDCTELIADALRRHGVAPRRLTLELMEAQAFDSQAHGAAVERLRALGVQLAMDDLGTGYSSIERLADLHFDSIKIDQALIARLYDAPLQTVTLTGTLVQLGAELGQSVVVEGVADPAMIEVAAVFGADQVQGYAICPPLPLPAMRDWVESHRDVADADGAGGPLRTYAGALAYHWRYVHMNSGHHPQTAETCALHAFLLAHGLADSEPAAWHAAVHRADGDTDGASRRLLAWLAGEVSASRDAPRDTRT